MNPRDSRFKCLHLLNYVKTYASPAEASRSVVKTNLLREIVSFLTLKERGVYYMSTKMLGKSWEVMIENYRNEKSKLTKRLIHGDQSQARVEKLEKTIRYIAAHIPNYSKKLYILSAELPFKILTYNHDAVLMMDEPNFAKGTFKKGYKMVSFSGEKVCILEIPKRDLKATLNELGILTLVNGTPNFPRTYGTYRDSYDTCYAVQRLEGRRMFDLKDQLALMPAHKKFKIIEKILRAVSHLHKLGIVHRDLHSGNILMNEAMDEPCIIDFGFAAKTRKECYQVNFVFEPYINISYEMAKAVQDKNYRVVNALSNTFAFDIWSLGLIMADLIFCIYPAYRKSYSDWNSQGRLSRFHGEIVAHVDMWKDNLFGFSARELQGDPICQLLRDMTLKDPDQRPSCDQVLNRFCEIANNKV